MSKHIRPGVVQVLHSAFAGTFFRHSFAALWGGKNETVETIPVNHWGTRVLR
jgi:hypothetical protein